MPNNTSSIEDQIRVREEKAKEMRVRGEDPYSADAMVTHTTGFMRAHCEDPLDPVGVPYVYRIAGRVMAIRRMGKVTFLSLRDRTGDLQVVAKRDMMEDDAYTVLDSMDIGDIITVHGRMMRTRAGELSIEAKSLRLLTKALRPLPDKWHGLADVETRYRQRYVDLAVNLEVREVFRKRAKLITGLRRFLDDRDYLEVETPTLHKYDEAGGAAARPFTTHHNALNLDLKLRIATELHLKRLIVGGLERVYEVGRIFRNEGIDRRHNPEFTSVELYQAYTTIYDMMRLTEELISGLAVAVAGSESVRYQGVDIDYSPGWPTISMVFGVAEIYGITSSELDALDKLTDSDWLAPVAGKCVHNTLKLGQTTGEKIAWAFEALVEPTLPANRPCFVVDFPVEVSPLARRRKGQPRLVDRFEVYAGGMEIANAFVELNDPRDQESRFRAQVEARAQGDSEAMPYDRDFIRALEYGMPPTVGEGIGIDRLAMLFTNSASIRDVILFPLQRPESED